MRKRDPDPVRIFGFEVRLRQADMDLIRSSGLSTRAWVQDVIDKALEQKRQEASK